MAFIATSDIFAITAEVVDVHAVCGCVGTVELLLCVGFIKFVTLDGDEFGPESGDVPFADCDVSASTVPGTHGVGPGEGADEALIAE